MLSWGILHHCLSQVLLVLPAAMFVLFRLIKKRSFNLLCVLDFFQNAGSQPCFRFFWSDMEIKCIEPLKMTLSQLLFYLAVLQTFIYGCKSSIAQCFHLNSAPLPVTSSISIACWVNTQ